MQVFRVLRIVDVDGEDRVAFGYETDGKARDSGAAIFDFLHGRSAKLESQGEQEAEQADHLPFTLSRGQHAPYGDIQCRNRGLADQCAAATDIATIPQDNGDILGRRERRQELRMLE